MNGFPEKPCVRINGRDATLILPQTFEAVSGRLMLTLTNFAIMELLVTALDGVNIRGDAGPCEMRFFWPAAPAEFFLEDLAAAPFGEWREVPGPPRANGSKLVYGAGTEAAAGCLRLRWQIG